MSKQETNVHKRKGTQQQEGREEKKLCRKLKLLKAPKNYTNPASSVTCEPQDGGAFYYHFCANKDCKTKKFRCVPHIPNLRFSHVKGDDQAPPPLEYGCRCIKEDGYNMGKCYCSSDCYFKTVRWSDEY
jgi:hypothetical protein